jgi:Type II secretion system (T2SS), protein M subtype b
MNLGLSWLSGLIIVATLSAASVLAITLPVRSGLRDLSEEARAIDRDEAAVVNELQELQKVEAKAVTVPTDLLWKKGTSTSPEIALQEVLVAKVSEAGLQLATFGETAPLESIGSATVATELEMTGTHEQLARFLAALETVKPPVAVSYLWLRQLPPDPAKDGSPISIRMSVWGFRDMSETP